MIKRFFGKLPNGRNVYEYEVVNSSGIVMGVINYGGIITRIEVPDRNGKPSDIVLGPPDLAGYLDDNTFMGALIGRFANRIYNGEAAIGKRMITLPVNQPPNHIHGGNHGFNKVYWEIEPTAGGILLRYLSPDGEEGYPGNLDTEVKYQLSDENELVISYSATTDKPTLINLTQHSYFNLSGTTNPITDHTLLLHSNRFLESDMNGIPTGNFIAVENTPFDFTTARKIGERIDADHPQIVLGNGYDHCYVLDHSDEPSLIASLIHEGSGRSMQVFTTEPGVQLYTGNHLNSTGKGGRHYGSRSGVCLETQHYPDSPNHPDFPSTELHPGEIYTSETRYKFGVHH